LRIWDWQCRTCGVVHDRNVNAAQNIARVGLGQMDKVGREPPEPKTLVEWVWPTMKPEAQALLTWVAHLGTLTQRKPRL
jgi:hypothetical protein